METIIGLLFILLPVIFKLIGKKLEQSGKTDVSEKMQEIVDAMEEDSPFSGWLNGSSEPQEEHEAPAPVQPVKPVAPKPVEKKPVVRKPAKKTVFVEEEKKKGEKIDPKKLVIYSEIMKPKFTE